MLQKTLFGTLFTLIIVTQLTAQSEAALPDHQSALEMARKKSEALQAPSQAATTTEFWDKHDGKTPTASPATSLSPSPSPSATPAATAEPSPEPKMFAFDIIPNLPFDNSKTDVRFAYGLLASKVRNVYGAQYSSFYSRAELVEGAQISGLVNEADTVKGVQIGVINIARRIEGVSFALFTFAENGIHEFDAGADNSGFATLGYKLGDPFTFWHLYMGSAWDDLGKGWDSSSIGLNAGFRIRPQAKEINGSGSGLYMDFEGGIKAAIDPRLSKLLWHDVDAVVTEKTVTKKNYSYTHTDIDYIHRLDSEDFGGLAMDARASIGYRIDCGLSFFAGIGMSAVPLWGSQDMPVQFRNGTEWDGYAGKMPFRANYRWFFGLSL